MAGRRDARGTIEERLSAKLKLAENGCWLFTGTLFAMGYGKISHKGISSYAHRVSWELHNGAIPEGMVIRHACVNRHCCNPEHLVLGTFKQNSEDRERTYIANSFPLYHY